MIELLLTYQPNVNFIEDESCANPRRAPVIHDAINRAMMCSRWNVSRPDGLEVLHDERTADGAIFLTLKFFGIFSDVFPRSRRNG